MKTVALAAMLTWFVMAVPLTAFLAGLWLARGDDGRVAFYLMLMFVNAAFIPLGLWNWRRHTQ